MAADKRTTAQETFAGFETAQNAYRDLMGFQVRTAKTLVETSLTYTRKATEQLAAQLEEGVKMQQDAIKYGLGLVEDWKKVAFESAEKAMKTENH